MEIARRAVETAADKQASDILMLDTREVCSYADYFVICSAESERQIEAIWDEINRVLKQEGILVHHYEGTIDSGWVLLDFGDVIIHIFSPAVREFYQLDGLWGEAIPILSVQ